MLSQRALNEPMPAAERIDLEAEGHRLLAFRGETGGRIVVRAPTS